MNDPDLRAALHRDADLVGEPSPDLLDQLATRRQHQRRQRTALLGVAAAVVIVAAGIPVGAALATGSHGSPAAPVAPTPAPTPQPAPTVLPTPAPTTPAITPDQAEAEARASAASAALQSAEAAASSAQDAATPPPCIQRSTALALLPAPDSAGRWVFDSQSWTDAEAQRCAGDWAVAFPGHESSEDGTVHTHKTVIYQWQNGSWQMPGFDGLDRERICESGQIPASLYPSACETN